MQRTLLTEWECVWFVKLRGSIHTTYIWKRGLSKKEWTARDHNGVLPNTLVNYVRLCAPPPSNTPTCKVGTAELTHVLGLVSWRQGADRFTLTFQLCSELEHDSANSAIGTSVAPWDALGLAVPPVFWYQQNLLLSRGSKRSLSDWLVHMIIW